MFLYNTTFSVEASAVAQWENWMKRNYFPSLANLLPDASYRIWEIMPAEEQPESSTFSCQWICNTPDELAVINKYSAALLSNLSGSFGDKCLYFSTILRKPQQF